MEKIFIYIFIYIMSVDFYKKYLTYKQKYLNLKSQVETKEMIGGADKKKNKLYLFKAEWCGHCKNFKSVWNQLQKDNNINDKIEFITYDADKHQNEINKFNIQGFPTLIFQDSEKMVEYNGSRDIMSVKEFINNYN